MDLDVGEICLPEESALMVALTLLRIFPRLDYIKYHNMGWGKVVNAISRSKRLANHSSNKHLLRLEVTLTPLPQGDVLEGAIRP